MSAPDRSGPLSIGQRGLWLQQRLAPDSRALTIAHAQRLRGRLDVPALRRTLQGIVDRHGALRTAIVERGGEPRREVVDGAALVLHEADGDERSEAVAAAAWRPWDLSRPPLMRASLHRAGPDDHVLVLGLHHAVADLWTMTIVAGEVLRRYPAECASAPIALPPPAASYADFVAWQAAHLESAAGIADRARWRARLEGAPAGLDLPFDHPPRGIPRGIGGRVPLGFGDDVTAALRGVARAAATTLPSLLLAAWQVLLARHAGADDVVVGLPVPGRTRAAWEGTAGYFVNTLPMRADTAADVRFDDLLRQTRGDVLRALVRQDIPFASMVEELRLPRGDGRVPLLPAMFVFQRVPRAAVPALAGISVGDPRARLDMGGVEVSAAALDDAAAPCDLTLELGDCDGRLTGSLVFDRDVFTPATARALAARFTALLGAIVRDPTCRLGALAMTDAAARRSAIALGTGPTPPRPHQTVPALLAAQVARTPDAVAIASGDAPLTYARLAARAHQIAHALRRCGARRGAAVGLALERSLPLVPAWLGILASGAAYVPLDPELPAARLAAMIEDAQVGVVIAAEGADAAVWGDVPVLALDATFAAVDHESCDAPDDPPRPDDAVSILFTSGTTGRPKGVVNTQRGLANRLSWFQETYPLAPTDRVVMKTPLGFDVSAGETLGALVAGAAVVVSPPGAHRDAAAMVAAIAAGHVTQAHFVPSMLRRFLAEPDLERCVALRRVLCSGEALTAELATRLRARLDVQLVNLYGPTEASVEVTHVEVPRDHAGPVPIGRPIAHAGVFVVDDALAPLPPGAVGEIVLGGVPLARGYVGRPALTAAAFVPAPTDFAPALPPSTAPTDFAPELRLYRTGDVGRVGRDGTIAYLGRRDRQVKLRGVRIELVEIEAALRALPGVADACAALVALDGDARLVAYVVPRAGAALTPAAVRAALRAALPAAHVPSVVVALAALPVTASGKLDRARLPAPRWQDGDAAGDDGGAPLDELERALAGWFGDVLGQPAPGRGADFFQLGGHSLLAARLIATIADRAGVALPLTALFEAPTVAALAQRVRDARASTVPPEAPIARRGDAAPALSFVQERLWFLDQLTPGPLYNLPLGLRLRGPLDATALARAFADVIARHDALRTAIVADGGRPRARIDAGIAPDWAVIDCAGDDDPAAAARVLAEAEARRGFALDRAPLLRVRLLRLAAHDHVLVVVMHHAVGDGWSWGVLLRELAARYAAARDGRAADLPDLPVQYADVAAWQRARATPARLAPSLAVWTRRLAGPLPRLALPTDRPRTARRTLAGAEHTFVVPADTAAALDALAEASGVTRFMTLLAAYLVLLARYTGQTDLVVGVPVAGRGRVELEGLIGCFVETLALRVSLADRATFRVLLGRVRETTVEALAHQDVPLERLVEALNPERGASHSPLFETMFALQNATGATPTLAGIDAERLPLTTGVARFELGLSLEETPAGLAGAIEYQTALFDAETIARFADHYARLCAAAARDPDAPIARLPFLPDAERAQVVVAWNQTARPLPEPATLSALFAAQARARPDAIAIEHGATRMTYGELDARARVLAARLRARGVGPERRVGVCLPRNAASIVAVVGIVLAGGAYVPLDPSHPPERLRFLRADAGVRWIVARRDLAAALGIDGDGARPDDVLWLDDDGAIDDGAVADAIDDRAIDRAIDHRALDHRALAGRTIDPIDDRAAAAALTPDALAYILYTSGSTGRPKGVGVPHRAIVRLVCETDYVRFGPADRVAQIASLAFDAATFEIWGALLHGGRLVIFDRDVTLSPPTFAAAIRAAGISVMMLTTALFNRLAIDTPDVLREIGTVYFGGEAVDPACVRAIVRRPGHNRILHGYGPTECTTAATWHHVTDVPDDATTIPIGRPIANTRTYILDAEQQPAPIGVPGELYLGGPGLARGYEGQPAQTAARFVHLALDGRPAERLYRTGDVARWRPGGVLEFVGRVDDQVKIRGQRVEPGEVEAVLAAHPAVRACAVVAHEDPRAGRQLVAYVEPHVAGGATAADLRAHLRARVPAFMVPARFVALARLPLGPTGKVDRRALPPPADEPDEPATTGLAFTPTERALVPIWAALLGRPPETAAHSFFDAGGHSLLAAQLVFRIGDQLGVALPLRAVFEDPTLAGLARALDAARGSSPAPDRDRLAPLRPATRGRPAFFVHPLGGSGFCYRALAAALAARGPRYALQDLDDAPARSIEALAALHLAALRDAAADAPLQLVGWSFGGTVAFEIARQARQAGHAVAQVVLLDTLPPGPAAAADAARHPPLVLLAADLASFTGRSVADLEAALRDAPPAAHADRARRWLAHGAGAPSLAEIDRLARLYARNLAALQTYRPDPADLPVTLVLARDGDAGAHAASHAGWRALTHAAPRTVTCPGDHHGILRAPHVETLARLVDALLC